VTHKFRTFADVRLKRIGHKREVALEKCPPTADLIDLGAVQFEQAMKNQYEEDELENAHSNKSSESR
jgi:hypothetical protein